MKKPLKLQNWVSEGLSRAAGFSSSHEAAEEVEKYNREQGEGVELRSNHAERYTERQKEIRFANALSGMWVLLEIQQNRIDSQFEFLGPQVKNVFLAALRTPVTCTGVTLPFPRDEVQVRAQHLPDGVRQTVNRFLEIIHRGNGPPSRGRKANKPPEWKHPPKLQIVDHSRSTREQQKTDASKLAVAVDKFLERADFKVASAGNTCAPLQFFAEYCRLVAGLCPRLALALERLCEAFCRESVGPEDFIKYFMLVPVVPPDDLRILFRKKILWVEER